MRATSLLLLFILPSAPAAAQQSAARTEGSALATREYLQETVARLEREGRSQAEVGLIRGRLASGDFQIGDRVVVRVEGEQQLSDTFTVGPGPVLVLPQVGAVPLGGVLRSELTGRLKTHLAHYIRDPVVQARPLIRILVEGDIAKPGFYAVPPELPLADVIGVAGGLTQRAKATGMSVERGRERIWSGERLQQALGQGYSLDQLNLRAGDRLFVPARGDFARTAAIIGGLIAIPLAIFTITRIRR